MEICFALLFKCHDFVLVEKNKSIFLLVNGKTPFGKVVEKLTCLVLAQMCPVLVLVFLKHALAVVEYCRFWLNDV